MRVRETKWKRKIRRKRREVKNTICICWNNKFIDFTTFYLLFRLILSSRYSHRTTLTAKPATEREQSEYENQKKRRVAEGKSQ